MRITRVATLFLVGLLLAVFPGATVQADPWGTDTVDTGSHPDGASHSFCYGTPMSSGKDNVDAAEWNALGGDTQAVAIYEEPCDTSGTTETDVLWRTGSLNPGTYGTTNCANYSANTGYCDRSNVVLDMSQMDDVSPYPDKQATMVACHELGHSVGLTHGGTNDCMSSNVLRTTDIGMRRYNDHHRSHINDWF